MAGYSGTPLPKKLGVKEGHVVRLVGAPKDFELAPLPFGVDVRRGVRGKTPFDVIVLFTKSERDLRARFPALKERMNPAAGLWVCWPKRASGVATDLSDGVVRQFGLSTGLVDNKVCAVDETWSSLRFVIRREDR